MTIHCSFTYLNEFIVYIVVGATKTSDIDDHTRVKCYREIMARYPKGRADVVVFQLATRMGGPREAIWHCIIGKNYGCTHFILERDHASPSPGANSNKVDFYGPYDARDAAVAVENELGIKTLPFEMMLYVPEDEKYYPANAIPQGKRILKLSGTEFQRRLRAGEEIPEWFSFGEVVDILRKVYVNTPDSSVPYMDMSSAVEVDNDAYAANYHLLDRTNAENKYLGFDTRSEMERMFNLIKHSLLENVLESKNATILNIGPGPAEMVQDFIDTFIPYCTKIVLCEVNESFCKDYKSSQWYKMNENKIEIINKPIEQLYNNENNETKERKFDLIWCNHVLYHLRLKYIPTFIEKLIDLLNNKDSYAIVGVCEDDNSFIQYTNKMMTKKYRLSRYFEECLNLIHDDDDDSNMYNWFMLRFHSSTPIGTKQDAIDVLKLFIIEDILHHPDYNASLKINDQDEKKLSDTIEIALKKTFSKCQNSGKLLLEADTNYYLIKQKH